MGSSDNTYRIVSNRVKRAAWLDFPCNCNKTTVFCAVGIPLSNPNTKLATARPRRCGEVVVVPAPWAGLLVPNHKRTNTDVKSGNSTNRTKEMQSNARPDTGGGRVVDFRLSEGTEIMSIARTGAANDALGPLALDVTTTAGVTVTDRSSNWLVVAGFCPTVGMGIIVGGDSGGGCSDTKLPAKTNKTDGKYAMENVCRALKRGAATPSDATTARDKIGTLPTTIPKADPTMGGVQKSHDQGGGIGDAIGSLVVSEWRRKSSSSSSAASDKDVADAVGKSQFW